MEISESAWAKAKAVVSDMGHSEYWDEYQEVAEAIARAIDQERRECAEIAYWAADVGGNANPQAVAKRISQDIRNK